MNLNANKLPQLILRLALGIGFLLPVADRLGLLGKPGTKGVAWGNWAHFTAYTQSLLPVLGKSAGSVFAVIATALEITFGICLIIGLKTKWNALGSALLTLSFAICMMATQGVLAPFIYPVFVFTGGGFLLACVEAPKWSVDSLFARKA